MMMPSVDRKVRNGLARNVAALTRNDMDSREFMNGALSWGSGVAERATHLRSAPVSGFHECRRS